MVKPSMPKKRGFTVVELLIVVAIIGLVSTLPISNYINLRTNTIDRACNVNKSIISEVVSLWLLDTDGQIGDPAPDIEKDLGAYFSAIPTCPHTSADYTVTGELDGYTVECSEHDASEEEGGGFLLEGGIPPTTWWNPWSGGGWGI